MGDVKLDTSRVTTGGNMIIYDAFHQCNPGVFARNEIGNLRLVPSFPVIAPEFEVDEHEEDNVDTAECEAYDNGLDPELDYPAIESECVSTEAEEDASPIDTQGTVVCDDVNTEGLGTNEIEFIKVECT